MTPTILLIDDDPMVARLVQLTLEPEGYQLVVAPNGLQGLKMAQTDPPDLLLLDLMLPGQDGFEVLNRLRAEPRTADVPVIVVSSKSQPTDKHTATKIGANAYLTKPYRRAELLETIRSLLSERSEKATACGTGVILVGSRGGEEASVTVYVGLALVGRGEKATVVDFRPFSVEHSLLLDVSPRPEPVPLSDPGTTERLAGLMVQHSSGLRLLDNLEGGGEAGQLTAEDTRGVLEALLAEGGVILVDLPLYPVQVLRQAANYCDPILLVTRSDRTSLAAARAALTQMQRAGVEENRTGIVFVGSKEDVPEFDQKALGSIPAEAGPDDPAFQTLADLLTA
ncbi:MAG: response regulator [Anaerolineae bacterium]